MKLRALAFAVCLAALLSPAIIAQSSGNLRPDRTELESASPSGLVFVSYEGPSSRIDSLAAIEGIGSSLGRAVSASAGAPARGGEASRYLVIHAIDPSVKEGLDADIIVLGAEAQVDHIRNLRWIIAGYLSSAWGYSEKDAFTIATFVTIYNAVHRGDLPFFTSKYKAVVRKELSAENAGLALNYAEWPGKSRIVIPLTSGARSGSLAAVDTGAVSDKAVVGSLKSQGDKGVPDRQALVDVKEREAQQLQADADKKKAEAAAAERQLAADKAKAEADRAVLEKEKAEAVAPATVAPNAPVAPKSAAEPAQTAASAATASPNAVASSPAASPASDKAATAELSTKEAAVAAEEAKVKSQEAEVAAKKEEAAKAESAAVAKKEEAAADRKDITADQKAAIASEVAEKGSAEAAGFFLIRVGDDANRLGQVVFVDPDKGKAIRSSRINSLHLRSLTELGDAFVAVSGLEGKAGGVRLVRLDKASLESVAEGKADMFPDSDLLASGGALYAIVKGEDGQYYVGEFAVADLSEKARSKEAVMPYCLLREASGSIAAQTPSGSFVLLRPATLEKAKIFNP
jgi:hypothetical protein